MLLGIVLHAGLAFTQVPWVVQDDQKSVVYDISLGAIHGFRMPLFFLLSGFFTMMLLRRRGLGGMLGHRAKRIALPLALGMVTIVPAMWGTFALVGSAPDARAAHRAQESGTDVWSAAAEGDIDALRLHAFNGTDLDAQDPNFGTTPLAFATIYAHPRAVRVLLDAGADPNAVLRDGGTPLHSAMFFGRDEIARMLLGAGADIGAQNMRRETPVDAMRHGERITGFIAGFLELELDFADVEAGRERIRVMLGEPERTDSAWRDLSGVARGLIDIPLFHHLWFLWYLIWLIGGLALVVALTRPASRLPGTRLFGPGVRVPGVFVAFPVCLVYLVPMTMATQSLMHGEFGPDTSVGLIPAPRVLAHYAVFFFFGAVLYAVLGSGSRFGRWWWASAVLGAALFPIAIALERGGNQLASWVGDTDRAWAADLAQALYAWLMVYAFIGACETILSRGRAWVRYVSDSSYWLYLAHLPLVILAQWAIVDSGLPVHAKFVLVTAVVTALLLASYALFVRHTWIGRLLNGPRPRGTPTGPVDLGAGTATRSTE